MNNDRAIEALLFLEELLESREFTMPGGKVERGYGFVAVSLPNGRCFRRRGLPQAQIEAEVVKDVLSALLTTNPEEEA